MYLERTGKHLKIMEEIGNLLIEDQTGNLQIKGILNASIVGKRVTSNLNVERNQRIQLGTEQTIGISDFQNLNNRRLRVIVILKWRKLTFTINGCEYLIKNITQSKTYGGSQPIQLLEIQCKYQSIESRSGTCLIMVN